MNYQALKLSAPPRECCNISRRRLLTSNFRFVGGHRQDVCDYGSGPDLLTDTDARTSIHAAEPVSMPPCSDLEKYDTQYYEFGDGVLDLILEQPTTDLPFETAETYPSSSSPSPLLHDRPSTTLRDPMNQKEFLTYMENFATSLGTILEKKLADVIGT